MRKRMLFASHFLNLFSCGISPIGSYQFKKFGRVSLLFYIQSHRSYFAKVAIVYKNASAFALA